MAHGFNLHASSDMGEVEGRAEWSMQMLEASPAFGVTLVWGPSSAYTQACRPTLIELLALTAGILGSRLKLAQSDSDKQSHWIGRWVDVAVCGRATKCPPNPKVKSGLISKLNWQLAESAPFNPSSEGRLLYLGCERPHVCLLKGSGVVPEAGSIELSNPARDCYLLKSGSSRLQKHCVGVFGFLVRQGGSHLQS